MGKNWLIRTRSNHILGPISKDKVLELYHNGSIKADDEVCSGNGYWFFIRESELVEKYLLGSFPQSFNPISEAKDVLTNTEAPSLPEEEYDDDITLVGGINLKDLEDKSGPAPVESQTNLEVSKQVKKKVKSDKTSTSINIKAIQNQKKQGYFKYFGILIFTVLVVLIYFRKSILKSFFESGFIPKIELIQSAQAQDLGKKKVFLSHR